MHRSPHGPAVHPRTPRAPRRRARRALILPAILLVLVLLAVLSASFSFQAHADFAGTNAAVDRLQARLAAEAGIQKVVLMLRTRRQDVDTWYDNRDEFRRVILWAGRGGINAVGSIEERDEGAPAYRFSIVADDPDDDRHRVRYGITDEASKLNINTAGRNQLTRLLAAVLPEETDVAALADALLDWRDPDTMPRQAGAEDEYYGSLPRPYRVKNHPFETTEELLMVRGFTGAVLFGEDHDRNGLLSPNEDDGDGSFPPDNADGKLDRGLLPYITVYSQDLNTANDNKPRINLLGQRELAVRQLTEVYEDAAVAAFIVNVANPASPGGGRGRGRRGTPRPSPEAGADQRTATGRGEPVPPSGPISTPAEVLFRAPEGAANPLRLDTDLPILMDKCTTTTDTALPGLININTAPPEVLITLPGLEDADVNAIVQARLQINTDAKATTAWLLTEGVITPEKFIGIANLITARGRQFTIESVGFADHQGTTARLQAVIEMRGPVAQTMYYRDLTRLGTAYPIRADEEETGLARRAD